MLTYYAVGVSLGIIACLAVIQQSAHALSTLSMEDEPIPLPINGKPVLLVGDEADRDVNIDPTKPLPPNGTEIINILPANDTDMNHFPPPGVKVIIENKTVTVTKLPITIGNSAPSDSGDGGDDDE